MPSLEQIQAIVTGAMEQMNATLENLLRPIHEEMAAYQGRPAAWAAAAAPLAARFGDAVAAVGGNNRPRFQPNSLPKFRFGEAVDIWIDLVSNEVTIHGEEIVCPYILGNCFVQGDVMQAWYMALAPV
jgi:hypothetical protein